MPVFEYKVINPQGKTIKGIVEAENAKAARIKLKKQQLTVVEIGEKKTNKNSSSSSMPFMGGGMGLKEVTMLTRQLASLVKANIPLVEALSALIEQSDKEQGKIILSTVRQDVNEGSNLSSALRKHSGTFDTIFVNMVEAGESSGTLSLVLMRLAELKEAQMRLRSKIISGMTYPALMMVVASVLMIAIFTFVIPKLAKVFETMNKPMPPITVFLLAASGFVTDYWYLLLGGFVFLIWLFRRYIKTTSGAFAWDVFKLRLPVLGGLIRMVAVTRFASTMSTLLGSGVPILNALAISRNLVGSIPIANAIAHARENITEGQSIAEPLRRSREFPPMVIHMIAIGEKTGELPEMLKNVAETYEEQVNSRIEGLTALLEPLMIVGMGGVVAFIVMSVFVPLLDISNINSR